MSFSTFSIRVSPKSKLNFCNLLQSILICNNLFNKHFLMPLFVCASRNYINNELLKLVLKKHDIQWPINYSFCLRFLCNILFSFSNRKCLIENERKSDEINLMFWMLFCFCVLKYNLFNFNLKETTERVFQIKQQNWKEYDWSKFKHKQ